MDLELAESAGPPQIIEIGAVRFDSDGRAERWSTLVRPTTALTYRIEQLTGLSTAELDIAPRIDAALHALEHFAHDLPLVGQSIDIDLGYLERAGLRLTTPAYDTFELAQLLIPGLPTYDLRGIARALEISPRAQHRALADAETAMEVFLALLTRLRALRLEILMLVNRLAAGLDWPLAPLFAEAERSATRRYLESVIHTGGAARLPDPEGLPQAGSVANAPPPLAPNPAAGSLDGEALAAALSQGGLLASQLAGYEERREQLAMLRAVSAAFRDGKHLVVEAGTGTGKSMAYLLPAVGFAAASGRRVVVSTNTINLQDQLVQKDLPTLATALSFPVRTALVKGRGNYLCLRRWQAFLRSDRMTSAEAMLGIKVAIWLEHTQTGDRAELRLTSEEAVGWGRLCALAEHCTPGRCPYHRAGTCFLARARMAAESAHVVVVNHALLLSDVATGSKVLPEYRYLVVDEAHHLEAEATEQLGVRLTERELLQALDHLQTQSGSYSFGVLSEIAALVQRVGVSATRVGAIVDRAARAEAAIGRTRGAIQDLFGELHGFVGARLERAGQDNMSLRITPAVRASRDWQRLERDWATLQERWLALARPVAELLSDLEVLAEAASRDGGAAPEPDSAGQASIAAGPNGAGTITELGAELDTFLRFSEAVQEALDRVLASPSQDEVYWLSLRGGTEIAVHAAPLHVGARLWDDLFSRKDAAIVTSATLTTEGSFRYLRDRLGLRDVRELQVGSPFNYHDATLVYVPTDMPEPGQAYHQHRLVDTLIELIGSLGGRTLILFTSHGQLRQTHEALRAPMEAQRVVLLGQNIDGSRARLLETFRAGPRAVLLGTTSFWEGVDVVGDALSCLVIARLPFAVPTDPVFAARSELFDDPFREYAVPQAILRFKQGFGRLIRSRSDRGVVAVLDRRLISKSYGRAFLGSLPDCVVRTGPARDLPPTAASWLARPATSDV